MTLFERLSRIPDPRADINVKHDLVDVVFLVFSAVLSGATGWKSIQEFGDSQLDWLRQYRQFENGIPKRHCIANIISMLDSDALLEALFEWLNVERSRAEKSVLAIDGKTLRGTKTDGSKSFLHVVNAYDVESGLMLYQQADKSKGKEVSLSRDVLDALILKNAIVTLDSLHCLAPTMAQIVKKNGDFTIQLKKNQLKLFEHVTQAFAEVYEQPDGMTECVQENQGHGRKEWRNIMQIDANLPPELKEKWPHIKTFIEVASERSSNGKGTRDSRWYVSSLELDVELAARTVREHWSVENQLHWVLDVVFREDELRVKDPDGASHLAAFNRAALNAIKQDISEKDSLAAKRRKSGWSGEYRSKIIFG